MHLLLQKPKSGSVMHQPTPKICGINKNGTCSFAGCLSKSNVSLSLTNSVNKLDIGIEIEMEFCTHCTQDLWTQRGQAFYGWFVG